MTLRATILSTGDELTTGRIADTVLSVRAPRVNGAGSLAAVAASAAA